MSRPKQVQRREQWSQTIAQQKASGKSIRAFCQEQQVNEHSFYLWRKQLEATTNENKAQPVRFALVETNTKPAPARQVEPLELILAKSGDRLRIPADAATIQFVLDALQKRTS